MIRDRTKRRISAIYCLAAAMQVSAPLLGVEVGRGPYCIRWAGSDRPAPDQVPQAQTVRLEAFPSLALTLRRAFFIKLKLGP